MDVETENDKLIGLTNVDSELKSEWSSQENSCLLELLGTYNSIPQLDDDSEQIYEELSKLMVAHGYERSAADVRQEWSKLLNKYSKGTKFEHHDEIQKLLNAGDGETEIIIMCDDNESPPDELKDKIKRWTEEETNCIIEVLEKYGLPTRRSLQKITRLASESLKKYGCNRSHEQIQLRLKKLRSSYYKVSRNLLKEQDFPFYDRMKELFEDYKQSLTKEQLKIFLSFNGDKNNSEDPSITAKQFWSEKETDVLLDFIDSKGITEGN